MGWFAIPGVHDGQRTLEEQMTGLEPSIDECRGKTVCDLGTSEGLIALEFARAGATVYACDNNREMIDYANATKGALPVTFELVDLNWVTQIHVAALHRHHDIVLALAVLHKLSDPAGGIDTILRMTPRLVVIRLPIGSSGQIAGKQAPFKRCDVNAVMKHGGYRREKVLPGPREELVQYWRRV